MSNKKICGIYKITNLENNKMYIGQSVDIEARWRSHKSNLKRNVHENIHLQNAYNKYGKDKFEFTILEECLKEDLDLKEKYYIRIFDTYKNGYNRDTGGSFGKEMSKESRVKMSESKLNISEELKLINREKNSIAHEFESIPILQIDLKGNIVKRWRSARYCSKKLNINQSSIVNCISHKRKTYKNYIWIYERERLNFKLYDYINLTAPKIVIQTDINKNVVNVFNGAVSVNKRLGFNGSSIAKAYKFKNKTKIKNMAYGYLWFLLEDYLDIHSNFKIEDYEIIDATNREFGMYDIKNTRARFLND